MLSLQIMNHLSTPQTRKDYAAWLLRCGADRVFLTDCTPMADPLAMTDEKLSQFAENLAFYRSFRGRRPDGSEQNGFAVGIWIGGLGHGGNLPPDMMART